jgi:hypothetical protein
MSSASRRYSQQWLRRRGAHINSKDLKIVELPKGLLHLGIGYLLSNHKGHLKRWPKKILKSVASHSLIVGIFTTPYLLYVLSDLYKIAVNDTTTVVLNNSLTVVLTTIPSAAFIIAFVSFLVYNTQSKNRKRFSKR